MLTSQCLNLTSPTPTPFPRFESESEETFEPLGCGWKGRLFAAPTDDDLEEEEDDEVEDDEDNLDEEEDIKRIVPTVLAIAKDPAAAKAKVAKARDFVLQKQRETMGVLKSSL